jgi:hypothetical protein
MKIDQQKKQIQVMQQQALVNKYKEVEDRIKLAKEDKEHQEITEFLFVTQREKLEKEHKIQEEIFEVEDQIERKKTEQLVH